MAADNRLAIEQGDVQVGEQGDLSILLNRAFRYDEKDTSEDADQRQVKQAVRTLAEQALADTALVQDDAVQSITKMIKVLDEKLSKQVNSIIHHPDFQSMEGAWRGLSHLVYNTETDETLKIRFMNIKKDDVRRMFEKFPDSAWDQSPLFKQLYEEEYDVLGGTPYGCVVGDYQFDHTAPDMTVLKGMAKIGSAMHAPFITSPKPSLFKMESWQELKNPRDLTKIFEVAGYEDWRSFRAAEDSRYIGLAMPRFLARLPWGPETKPVEGFNFKEETSAGDHSKYTWANSAYAMATNITRSFKLYGWCANIRGVQSGGAVENLPTHTFETDDGTVDTKCPTEIGIGDRRELELAKNGMMPLTHKKHSNEAAFIGAQSLHKPPVYEDPAATANANLGARLPYLFATTRFAHYLKVMVRNKVGEYTSTDDLRLFLHNWIHTYVNGNPESGGLEAKAKRPLAAAEVFVTENKANPGYYNAQFLLKPHYQLEGLNVSLRLVSQLKSERGQ